MDEMEFRSQRKKEKKLVNGLIKKLTAKSLEDLCYIHNINFDQLSDTKSPYQGIVHASNSKKHEQFNEERIMGYKTFRDFEYSFFDYHDKIWHPGRNQEAFVDTYYPFLIIQLYSSLQDGLIRQEMSEKEITLKTHQTKTSPKEWVLNSIGLRDEQGLNYLVKKFKDDLAENPDDVLYQHLFETYGEPSPEFHTALIMSSAKSIQEIFDRSELSTRSKAALEKDRANLNLELPYNLRAYIIDDENEFTTEDRNELMKLDKLHREVLGNPFQRKRDENLAKKKTTQELYNSFKGLYQEILRNYNKSNFTPSSKKVLENLGIKENSQSYHLGTVYACLDELGSRDIKLIDQLEKEKEIKLQAPSRYEVYERKNMKKDFTLF